MSDLAFLQRVIAHAPVGFNARHLAALMVLRPQPTPMRFRELAKGIGIPKPSLTRILDALSRHGFAERRRSPKDARDCVVTITDEGRKLLLRLEGRADLERAA